MRTPFIASWIVPDPSITCQRKTPINQNGIQTQMATILDIFPTICHMTNVSVPYDYPMDGFDLSQQLTGKRNYNRDEIFLNHFPHGNHRTNYFTSLVQNDWKIIYHYPLQNAGRYELYNLKTDPFETKNVADQNREKLSIMMRLMSDELKDKKALLPEKDGKVLKLEIPQFIK